MEMPGHGLNDMNCVQQQMNGTRPRSFSDYRRFSKAGHGPYLNHRATVRRTHAHLKGTMMERLNLDTDKNCVVACEQLMLRWFREGVESVAELARDLERMLDKSSPGLPVEIRKAELRFYLMSSLLERLHSSLRYHQRAHMQRPFQKLEKCC